VLLETSPFFNGHSSYIFKRVYSDRENRLLASSCLYVRLSACIVAARAGRIFAKFVIASFPKFCRNTPDLVKIGQD